VPSPPDTSPSITVVTPCLNARATIDRTLESLAAQEYANLEHIVIDGGSTDGTLERLESAGVQFTSEPDNGLAEALNRGVRAASGDIIGTLNADDLYLPGALRRVADAFRTQPNAWWVTGRCVVIGAHDEEIRRPITAYKNVLLDHYSFPLYLTQNFISAPATFIARRAFDAIGYYNESLRYAMDYDLFVRLAHSRAPLILSRPAIAAFRMSGQTLSMTGFERQFIEDYRAAQRYRVDYPVVTALHAVTSRGIILTYQTMRAAREAVTWFRR
jgi:glycosyltransferase involved in cell wall biosynthesis